ncbi:uncharacterized protein LOC132547140 [Ylistrum balloti]|uniref:uncharacterized protein LOC132547140 n=1 Tax=Ylistrum balloti TaxID=509963 RepID=UPI002905F4DD|nr:uncharacterized protein LOC132547140 [Ylistrum balloti]
MWRDCSSSSKSRSSYSRGAMHKRTPTHFIAFQIINPEILEEIKDVQRSMLSNNPSLIDVMVPGRLAHITLMVVNLQNYHYRQRAKDALNLCASRLKTEYRNEPIVLDLAGIGNFRNKVVFAKIHDADKTSDDILQHVHGVVKSSFEEYGIYTTDTRADFNPHLTLAKTQNDMDISEYVYKDRIDNFFGRELVNRIQLCAMGVDGESSYYDVLHQVKFGSRVPSSSHCEKYYTRPAAGADGGAFV